MAFKEAQSADAEDVYGKDEAFAKMLMELLRTQNPKMFSEVYQGEITLLTGVGIVKNLLQSEILETTIKEFLEYRVSLDRKGRDEIVSLAMLGGNSGRSSKGKSGIKSILAGLR